MSRARPLPVVATSLCLAASLLTGCGGWSGAGGGASRAAPAAGQCPQRWDVGVVWSSLSEGPSRIDYLSGGHVTGSTDVPALGVAASPDDTVARTSWGAAIGASGNEKGGPPALFRFDSSTCRTTLLPRPDPDVLALAATDRSFVTLDGHNVVRTVDPRTRGRKQTILDGPLLTRVTRDGRHAYAIGDAETTVLVVLDVQTMQEVRRLALPGVAGTGGRPLVHDGKLYYAQETVGHSSDPGRAIGVVDLATMTRSSIPLSAPGPHLLELTGDDLYVGHVSPQGQPGETSIVSRVALRSGRVTTHPLDFSLDQLAVRGRTLHTVGTAVADGRRREVYRAFDARTFSLLTATDVEAPSSGYYHAGLVLPPS